MWLAKLFNLRDDTSRSRGVMSVDEEKPFLAHLEDLRTMIVRVVITLIVMTILAFVFNKKLFELIKEPARKAGVITDVSLPIGVEFEDWEQIRKLNLAAVPLSKEQRSLLLDAAFADSERWDKDADLKALRDIADVHYTYLAADQLKGESRNQFIQQALSAEPKLLTQAMRLVEANTPAALDGNVSAIKMQALSPTETFKLSIKLSLYAGIVIAFPLLFYFVAQFVFPGLTERERKLLWPTLSVGFGLFIVGVLFSYFVVTVKALEFFHGYSSGLGVEDQWQIGEYVSFATQLVLIFGLSFELPVVVMALVKLGLLSHEFMLRTRSYAIVIIFVVAAVITPTPDATVLSALAVPMIILYEICIWLAWFIERKDKKKEKEEEEKQASRSKMRSVTPAAGALPVAAEQTDSKVEPSQRPYDAHSPDTAHNAHDHDPDYDDYHDHDHGHEHGDHGDSQIDYDPYSSDGYYDDFYKDNEADGSGDEPESSASDDAATNASEFESTDADQKDQPDVAKQDAEVNDDEREEDEGNDRGEEDDVSPGSRDTP